MPNAIRRSSYLRAIALVVASAGILAGCIGALGGGVGAMAAAALLAAFLVACGTNDAGGGDGDVSDEPDVVEGDTTVDVGEDADVDEDADTDEDPDVDQDPDVDEDPLTDAGTWEACCNSGIVDTCYCPAGAACNYGWYTDCGDGTCIEDPSADVGACDDVGTDPDVDEPETDAGDAGYWEACCSDGIVDTCYCPAGTACNYGWYTDCGDGTCVAGPDADAGACDDADVGMDVIEDVPDADVIEDVEPDGTWEACCIDGVVDSCFCPGGAECNYGWYTDCGDGTCATGFDDVGCDVPDAGGDADADVQEDPDADADAGTWQACCIDGAVDSCFCPAGVACNYFYVICEDGTCAFDETECSAP